MVPSVSVGTYMCMVVYVCKRLRERERERERGQMYDYEVIYLAISVEQRIDLVLGGQK